MNTDAGPLSFVLRASLTVGIDGWGEKEKARSAGEAGKDARPERVESGVDDYVRRRELPARRVRAKPDPSSSERRSFTS